MITLSNEYLNLHQIADSGQCFRWIRSGENEYTIPAFGRTLVATQDDTHVVLDCSAHEYESVWRSYFDVDSDYGVYYNAALESGLPYLQLAAGFSKGVRILRQELWETALSFVISQNNNIPRIKKILDRIVDRFGRFPDPSDITEGSLSGLQLGYREQYVYNLARAYSPNMTDFQCIKGIGSKVNSCILLYGQGRKDAFPRDVWVKRIEQTYFDGRFPEERFDGFAGVMQQYLFYYAKHNRE